MPSEFAVEPLMGNELLTATRRAVDATVHPLLDGAPDAAAQAATAWNDLADLRETVVEQGFPLGEEVTELRTNVLR